MSPRHAPALALTLFALGCARPNPLFLDVVSEGGSGGEGSTGASTTGTSSLPDTTSLDPSGAAGTDGATSTTTTTTTTTGDASTGAASSTGAPFVCPVTSGSIGVELIEAMEDLALFPCDAPKPLDRYLTVVTVNGAKMSLKSCAGCPCANPSSELTLAVDFAAKDKFFDIFTPGDCIHVLTQGAYDPGFGNNTCAPSALWIFDDTKDQLSAPPRALIHRGNALNSFYAGKLEIGVTDAGPGCDSELACEPPQGDHALTFTLKTDGVEIVQMGLFPGFSLIDVLLNGPGGPERFDIHPVRAAVDEGCAESSEWALRRTL